MTLGGQEYEIRPLPMGPSREWRESISGPVGQLIDTLKGLPSVELDDMQSWDDEAGNHRTWLY